MKLLRSISLTLLVVLMTTIAWENPILPPVFTEMVLLPPTGWVMEFHTYFTPDLDGWYLTSLADTAYFKNGIVAGDKYLVITPDSLQQPLLISRFSDIIALYSPQGMHSQMMFGPLPGSMIAAPRYGQSIAFKEDEYFYYLDNTPTLGSFNDTANAMGTIAGTVTDTLGNPLSGVQVWYHDWMGWLVLTDSYGRYSFTDYAKVQSISFVLPGYNPQYPIVQAWPESTITVDVVLKRIVSVGRSDPGVPPGSFKVTQNYPNPFNPSTTFDITLPHPAYVTVKVFTTQGEDVATLLSERLGSGTHQLRWTPVNLPSGIYLCNVRAGSFSDTKKLLLLH